MKIEYYCTCGKRLGGTTRAEKDYSKVTMPIRVVVELEPCPRCLERAAKEAKGK